MFSLIDRYIVRSHIVPFIFGTGTVIFIFLMQFLMISLEQLVGKGLSEWLIIKLIVYNMSWMVILAVPMGVLFSTLMAFGSMSMSHEVTIIKASGGSLIRMMTPVIISAFFIYIALFWFNDRILPESNHQVKIMMNDIQRKKPTFALESGLFSTQLDGYTILSRHVDSLTGSLSGVTIYDMTKFQTRNIISADSGKISFTPDYKKLVLDLKDGEIHQFSANTVDNYKIINFHTYRIAMNAYGFAFEESRADMVSKGDREMNVADMNAIVDTADAGREKVNIRVDSLIDKAITDIIFGKKEIKTASIKMQNNRQTEVSQPVLTDNKITDKKPLSSSVKKIKKETENTISSIPTKKVKKSDSGLSYLEMVNRKFKKAVNEGNIDLNKDTILSEAKNRQITEVMKKEREKIVQDSLKAEFVKQALNKVPQTLVNKSKSSKTARSKSNTASIPVATNPEQIKFDTSYTEVLNRVLQQLNLAKSTIQPDINNIKFFAARSKQYEVEIYKKYAIPFACLIFVFVGAPLGVMTKGGNFGISAGISLAFYIFYWGCLIGGEKFADRGYLATWLSMWMANIVVGIIGIVLTIRVSNETFNFKIPFLSFFRKKIVNQK